MSIASICADLQVLERELVFFTQSRIMLENRMTAWVANQLGYFSRMDEAERKKVWSEASKLVAEAKKGHIVAETDLIVPMLDGLEVLDKQGESREKLIERAARQLPVSAWVELPEQRGCSVQFMGRIIGETGDLTTYANPAKVWRRLGCAPFTNKKGITLMGSTWRKQDGLSKEEWIEFGYSPRRRSISYLLGVNLVKSNDGVYRQLYDETKERKYNDWDFSGCRACKATGKEPGAKGRLKNCETCKGEGRFAMRAHRTAMLVASKRFLRNLWCAWHGKLPYEEQSQSGTYRQPGDDLAMPKPAKRKRVKVAV